MSWLTLNHYVKSAHPRWLGEFSALLISLCPRRFPDTALQRSAQYAAVFSRWRFEILFSKQKLFSTAERVIV